MLTGPSSPGPDPAPRILNPYQVLTRLRPVKLWPIGKAIFPHLRRVQALFLLRRFFPGDLWDVLPLDDWTDILRYFLFTIEAKYEIDMDWGTLDDLYQWAMEDSPETDEEDEDPAWEPGGYSWLAEALRVIPVRCFGWDTEGWNEPQITDYPAMQLLQALLEPGGHEAPPGGGFAFLEHLGDWDEADKMEALDRLDRLDVSGLPEPLCWLPELGRYACGETGNDLLDQANGFEKWTGWHTWDELEAVAAQYVEARAVFEKMESFNAWACPGGEGSEERLRLISSLIIGAKL